MVHHLYYLYRSMRRVSGKFVPVGSVLSSARGVRYLRAPAISRPTPIYYWHQTSSSHTLLPRVLYPFRPTGIPARCASSSCEGLHPLYAPADIVPVAVAADSR